LLSQQEYKLIYLLREALDLRK